GDGSRRRWSGGAQRREYHSKSLGDGSVGTGGRGRGHGGGLARHRRGGKGRQVQPNRGKTPRGEMWSRAPIGETGEGKGAKGERGGKMPAMAAAAACAGGAGARARRRARARGRRRGTGGGRRRCWPSGGARRGRPRMDGHTRGRGGGRASTRARWSAAACGSRRRPAVA
ncbi:hypothetical protein BS78_02G074300, partial [Paspalum vaginatum]